MKIQVTIIVLQYLYYEIICQQYTLNTFTEGLDEDLEREILQEMNDQETSEKK